MLAYKVYRKRGGGQFTGRGRGSYEKIADCKYADDAATLAGMAGEDSEVRRADGKVLWKEGVDGWACDSADEAAAYIVDVGTDARERAI